MQVEIFALCEAATADAGKMNILGVFDTINTKNIPAVHPQCTIALRLRFSKMEAGTHDIQVDFVNADGKCIIPPAKGKINVVIPDGLMSGIHNLILNIQRLKLEKYGEYAVNLAIDSRQEAIFLPLLVKKHPNRK